MSIRPGSAPPVAAGQPQPNRLKLVLQSGYEKKTADTGVIVPYQNPGQILPVPAPAPVDPSIFREAGKSVPGLYEERKTYPKAVWDVLEKDGNDRSDAYGNQLHFEIENGKEVLRSVTTGFWNGPKWGKFDFDGPSGEEYATKWESWQGDVIEFDGKSRVGQSIKALSLRLGTVKALADALPPPLDESALIGTERDLYSSTQEYVQLYEVFSALGYKRASLPAKADYWHHRFFDGAERFADFVHLQGYKHPTSISTFVKMDPVDGLRFHYDNIPSEEKWSTGSYAHPETIMYRPSTQADGWVYSGKPAAVIRMGENIYSYRREASGELVLDESQSVGDFTDVPKRFDYRTYKPEPYSFKINPTAMAALASFSAFMLCGIAPYKLLTDEEKAEFDRIQQSIGKMPFGEERKAGDRLEEIRELARSRLKIKERSCWAVTVLVGALIAATKPF